ncbi:hypothetical protein PTKIN_Ptkin08bG0173100 [Pterospermum kingtungense]
MSSHTRRDNGPSKFTSKTPHFFKVILGEAIRDGKLGIPRNFVRKHGNRLPTTIQLEVPSGATWQVQLTKFDETMWLQKGWQEFAEHYSLKFGCFLVFRYEGNGRFHVLVFDKSASEIEYPCTNTDEDDDEMSVGRCNDDSASRKRKEKSNFPCPRPHKKIRTDSPNQPGNDLKIKPGNLEKVEKSRCSTEQLDATKGVGGTTAPRSVKAEVLSCSQQLTAIEKAHAIQRVSDFKCTGNPVFMVVMQPSFVNNGYRMVIPWNFAQKYLTTQKGNLTLCDSSGKTWPSKYIVIIRPKVKKAYAYMHGGWRAFAEDNNLVVGDICVFELIKHLEILLKVVIFPVAENASKACRPPANGRIGSRVKIRSLVSDIEPNCRQSRCSSSSRQCIGPKIEENENRHPYIEVLDDFSLSQKAKKKSPSPCFQPCKIMRTNPSGSIQAKGIKVENQNKSPKELQGQFKYSAKDDTRRCPRAGLVDKMQASALKCENPSFTVLMHPSYVLSGFSLRIPYKFANRYFKKNGKLILRVSDGRTWVVDHKLCSLYATARFSSNSWRPFAVDNKLKVGDMCVFELINENGILLDVVIFPAKEV